MNVLLIWSNNVEHFESVIEECKFYFIENVSTFELAIFQNADKKFVNLNDDTYAAEIVHDAIQTKKNYCLDPINNENFINKWANCKIKSGVFLDKKINFICYCGIISYKFL